jgi:hypothetical protein
VFHADRWDYVFTFKRQGVEPQLRKLTVFFKGDALERFEGDEMPSEAEFVARSTAPQGAAKVPVLEATEEQPSRPSSRQTRAEARAGRARCRPAGTYPPLEACPMAAGAPAAPDVATAHDRFHAHSVAVAGASGRMGHMLIEAMRASRRLRAGRRARHGRQPGHRQDAGAFLGHASGVPVTADLHAGLQDARGADRLHPARRHAGPSGGAAQLGVAGW